MSEEAGKIEVHEVEIGPGEDLEMEVLDAIAEGSPYVMVVAHPDRATNTLKLDVKCGGGIDCKTGILIILEKAVETVRTQM
jgi:hypothetical protein